jgi:hypothetical protein
MPTYSCTSTCSQASSLELRPAICPQHSFKSCPELSPRFIHTSPLCFHGSVYVAPQLPCVEPWLVNSVYVCPMPNQTLNPETLNPKP